MDCVCTHVTIFRYDCGTCKVIVIMFGDRSSKHQQITLDPNALAVAPVAILLKALELPWRGWMLG